MNYTRILIVVFLACFAMGCTKKRESVTAPHFSRIDSLTEMYLDLHDSMLGAWNVMIHDDNEKIRSMQRLVRKLRESNVLDPELLSSLESRLNELQGMRFSPETLGNADVVEQYDFASGSLVSELIAQTESVPTYPQNTVLRQCVEQIQNADERMPDYRKGYDDAATAFNQFVAAHKMDISQIDKSCPLEGKPLFEMTADSE